MKRYITAAVILLLLIVLIVLLGPCVYTAFNEGSTVDPAPEPGHPATTVPGE